MCDLGPCHKTLKDVSKNLSVRQRKRSRQKQHVKELKRQNLFDSNRLEQYEASDYYFENGLRKVYPYHFTFTTCIQDSWSGRPILEVFAEQFQSNTKENYRKSVESGDLRVNGQAVSVDYILKTNDVIVSKIHRHENPVADEDIEVIHEDKDVLVVNKPASVPCQPCGRYRFNSIVFILCKELRLPTLRSVVTLDQPIGCVSHRLFLWKVTPKGKPSKTMFERMSFNGTSSVVKCTPMEVRTAHHIRVHLQYLGHPILNDPVYNSDVWGPTRGKAGVYHRPDSEVIEDVVAIHTVGQWTDELNPILYRKMNDENHTNSCNASSECTNVAASCASSSPGDSHKAMSSLPKPHTMVHSNSCFVSHTNSMSATLKNPFSLNSANGTDSYKPQVIHPNGTDSYKPQVIHPNGTDSYKPQVIHPNGTDSYKPQVIHPNGTDSYKPQVIQPNGTDSYKPQVIHPNGTDSYKPQVIHPNGTDSYKPQVIHPNGTDSYKPQVIHPNGTDSYKPQVIHPNGTDSYKPQVIHPNGTDSYKPQVIHPLISQVSSRQLITCESLVESNNCESFISRSDSSKLPPKAADNPNTCVSILDSINPKSLIPVSDNPNTLLSASDCPTLSTVKRSPDLKSQHTESVSSSLKSHEKSSRSAQYDVLETELSNTDRNDNMEKGAFDCVLKDRVGEVRKSNTYLCFESYGTYKSTSCEDNLNHSHQSKSTNYKFEPEDLAETEKLCTCPCACGARKKYVKAKTFLNRPTVSTCISSPLFTGAAMPISSKKTGLTGKNLPQCNKKYCSKSALLTEEESNSSQLLHTSLEKHTKLFKTTAFQNSHFSDSIGTDSYPVSCERNPTNQSTNELSEPDKKRPKITMCDLENAVSNNPPPQRKGHPAIQTSSSFLPRHRPSFDLNRWIPDPHCAECAKKYIDPNPQKLQIYLHALRYKGPGWEYSTKLPPWAEEHWEGE